MALRNGDLQCRAERVAGLLGGRSLACAESCTAGLLAQAFAAVEGSGDWFRGSIVAYQRCVKVELLDVAPTVPLVSVCVAERMARATARQMNADVTIATTGAAGPDPLDGAPPGTVIVGILTGDTFKSIELSYVDEEPEEVVERAAVDAVDALATALIAADGSIPTPNPN
jgi:nicotinamide-nucleotide amidase